MHQIKIKDMEDAISLSGEKLAFTLKVYQDNEARITKQLKSLNLRLSKINRQKETLEDELVKVKTFIKEINGEEPSVVMSDGKVENSSQAAEKPSAGITDKADIQKIIDESAYGPTESLGIDDTSGFKKLYLWTDKIDYVLKNAPMASKRATIARYLRGLDDNLKIIRNSDLVKTVAPYLSRMAAQNQVIKGSDGTPGDYYLHPSWVEDGKIKSEFKERCPENLRIMK